MPRARFATIISGYMRTVDSLTPAKPDPDNPDHDDPGEPIPVDPYPTLILAR